MTIKAALVSASLQRRRNDRIGSGAQCAPLRRTRRGYDSESQSTVIAAAVPPIPRTQSKGSRRCGRSCVLLSSIASKQVQQQEVPWRRLARDTSLSCNEHSTNIAEIRRLESVRCVARVTALSQRDTETHLFHLLKSSPFRFLKFSRAHSTN